jgi:putative SOS response-associated peptidase YedK
MCNHYKANADWRQRMGEHSETKIPVRFDATLPRVNVQGDDIFPGYIGEIVMPQDDRLVAVSANWNLMPFTEKGSYAEWMKKRRGCNNARGEEADTKWPWSMVKANRCLIPGQAFFEWDNGPVGGKSEYRFEYADGRPFFFGGLFCRSNPPEGPLLSYTMVTKGAGGDTASINHPRQPVILGPDEGEAWLDTANTVASFTTQLDPAGTFAMTPVKGPKAALGIA